MTDHSGMTLLTAAPKAFEGVRGTIVYLARERSSQQLVALQLHPADGPNSMWLEVLRRLDATLPTVEERCSVCHQMVKPGSRFCAGCGADLSLVSAGSAGDEVLEAVKKAAGSKYE